MKLSLALLPLALGGSLVLWCQEPNPTQNLQNSNPQTQTDSATGQNTSNPVFRVQVVSRTIKAVSYRNRSGWTKLDFQGTALAPKAKGSINVNSRKGYIQVKAIFKGSTGHRFGSEYLTYVLWAITPDGAQELRRVVSRSEWRRRPRCPTDLQSFGLTVR